MRSGIEILTMLEKKFFSAKGLRYSEAGEYLIELIDVALNEAYEQGKQECLQIVRRISEKH